MSGRPARLVAAAVLAAAILAGCGDDGGSAGPSTQAPVAVAPGPARPPTQAANGPLYVDANTRPLAVKLGDPRDPVHQRFRQPPRSGLLFDLDTGEVLWRKDPTRILPIASLTKMMTATLVAERLAPDDKARISKEVLGYSGSGVGVLPRGKRVSVENLLNGLMLVSGNDAAIALALRAAGSQKAFVARMNQRAQELGMSCTHYASPSGIVDAHNHSCASDLAAQARMVLDVPRLAAIVKRRRVRLRFPIKGGRLELYNTNPLLRRGYPGVIGVKTGYTDAAGRCLVAAAQRGGRRLGVVLLHSPDPERHARVLLNRGFRVLAHEGQ
ncbi:D-alanyl-D-alanine carboxypeptidase family protein [Conexibacter sp. SYSU D00693]|uniref:D-alanyl-D-alanine carboxypeptidase family protein n=1 Tax=Conexibacter sp. SYSU D00693 TaxID=2812560 RepID=UPI00196B2D62|nr:serine hydrolase [Conexibacter sp. SYSU D00693]